MCAGESLQCYNCTDFKDDSAEGLDLTGITLTPGCNSIDDDEFVRLDARKCPEKDDVCVFLYAKAKKKSREDDSFLCMY